MKKFGKELQELLKKAPTMSMDELEGMNDPNDFDMDSLERELNEDESDEATGFIAKAKSVLVNTIDRFVNYMDDGKALTGFIVGLMWMCIACALTHGKKWVRINK